MPRQPRPHFQIPFHHHHHHHHHYHLLIKEGNSNISLATALHTGWPALDFYKARTHKYIKNSQCVIPFLFSFSLFDQFSTRVSIDTHTHKFHIWNSFPHFSFFFFFYFPTLVGPWIVVVVAISQVVGRRDTIMETGEREKEREKDVHKRGEKEKKSETSNNAISLLVPHEVGPTAAGPDLILLRVARRAQWPIDWKSSGARVRDPMYIYRGPSPWLLFWVGGWLGVCYPSNNQPTRWLALGPCIHESFPCG